MDKFQSIKTYYLNEQEASQTANFEQSKKLNKQSETSLFQQTHSAK